MKMLNKGPIPGENMTSDTRKYPWHRPPQYVKIDDAVNDVANRIFKKVPSNNILTLLESGATISTVTSMIVVNGVGKGKWTVDLGLLIAGPIARMVELMAKGADIEYRMGLEEDDNYMTPASLKNRVMNSKAHKAVPDKEDIMEEIPVDGIEAGDIEVEDSETEGFSKPPKKGDMIDGI